LIDIDSLMQKKTYRTITYWQQYQRFFPPHARVDAANAPEEEWLHWRGAGIHPPLASVTSESVGPTASHLSMRRAFVSRRTHRRAFAVRKRPRIGWRRPFPFET